MKKAVLSVIEGMQGSLDISLSGDWLLGGELPGPDPVLDRLRKSPKPTSLAFDSQMLGDWDTGLVKTLIAINVSAGANGVEVDDAGLPAGARQLVALAFAVEEREGARRVFKKKKFLEQVGDSVMTTYNHATLFGIWSLFQAGQSKAAWRQLEKLLPFTSIHNNYNLTPFVLPNSYIHNMEKGLNGESMNDWQTGSSNVLLKILIWYVFGFRPELNHLRIQPDPWSPLVQFSYIGTYQNKKIVMSYQKTSAVNERVICLNEKPLELRRDDELNVWVADLPYRKLGKENQIKISDPLSMSH